MCVRLCRCLVLLVSLDGAAAPWPEGEPADEPLQLMYNERLPYAYQEQGRVQGLVAEPIERAFREAGIPFRWAEAPVARQLQDVRRNESRLCLAGRYKTADRAHWARFTRPIYRDLPQVLVVRQRDAARWDRSSLSAALRAQDYRLLVKRDYSYGPVVDTLLLRRDPEHLKVTSDENVNLLRQVQLGMADATLMSDEEAQALLQKFDFLASSLTPLRFRESPPGELRYVMCSLKVSEALMQRLDMAIRYKSP